MAASRGTQWNDRPVSDAAAVPDLDVAAAVHQFGGGVTREEAEERAYGEYRKRLAAEAAAHHLRLYRAAQSAGDRDVANRHKLMYDVHVRALGENPAGQPPQAVRALAGEGADPATKFKPHPADSLPLTKTLPWGDYGDEDDAANEPYVTTGLSFRPGSLPKQRAFRSWRDLQMRRSRGTLPWGEVENNPEFSILSNGDGTQMFERNAGPTNDADQRQEDFRRYRDRVSTVREQKYIDEAKEQAATQEPMRRAPDAYEASSTRFRDLDKFDSLPLTKALPWGMDYGEADDEIDRNSAPSSVLDGFLTPHQMAFRRYRDRVATVREQRYIDEANRHLAAQKPMAQAAEAGNRFAALDLREPRPGDDRWTVPWAPDKFTSAERRQKLFRQWRGQQDVGPEPPTKHTEGCRKGRCLGECHAPDEVMCVGRYGSKMATFRTNGGGKMSVPVWASKVYRKQQRQDGSWTYRLVDQMKGPSGRQPSNSFVTQVKEWAAGSGRPYVAVNHGDMPEHFKKFPEPHIDPSDHLERGRFGRLDFD